VQERRENSKQTIMHLGKFYWPERGGIETALRQISEAGIQLGYEVLCRVSQKSRTPTQSECIQQVQVKRYFSLGTFLSVPMSFGLWFDRQPEVSILHLHLPHPLAEIYTLFRINPLKTKIIPYFHAFPVGHGKLGRLWFQWITLPILKRSHQILISNPEMLKIVPELNQFSEKITILPFCTDSITEEQRLSLFSSREENKTVLAVGRIVPYKGFQNLLQAWKKLMLSHPDLNQWKLVIVGDGPELPNLKKWTQENLSSENILFTGDCDDETKNLWFKKSTLFILSSISTAETFGISLLEAFGMGLPAIVSDLPGGVSTLARNGECGKTFSIHSNEDLTQALHFMMTSADQRNFSGQKNLKLAQERFSSKSFLSIYEKSTHAK
jgi:rhamnosyl/mannosyltransferase